MLHIKKPENLRVGQVLCLHIAGQPEPDLSAKENPYVITMIGMDTTNGRGVSRRFYACNRHGAVLDESETKGSVMPMRLNPGPSVEFIPVVQLKWNDVKIRKGGNDEKYVVYNPSGVLLKRLRMPDGWTKIDEQLYFKPTCDQGRFTFDTAPLPEDPQDILRAFARESKCGVDELVFVPSG